MSPTETLKEPRRVGNYTSRLKAGDTVTVRSLDAILSTLDANCAVNGMPFMPEMASYCGKTLRVSKVAHKTCDTAFKTGGRALRDVYHLDDTRCGGSAHGGCQATCLLFWHRSWLELGHVLGASAEIERPSLESLERSTRQADALDGSARYACQATRLYDASEPLPWWRPGQYVRDLTSGNVPFSRFWRVILLSWVYALTNLGIGYRFFSKVFNLTHSWVFGGPAPQVRGVVPKGTRTPATAVGFERGDRVIVRSREEIFMTLDTNNKNRGLWFDREYLPFCGTEQVVSHRVERIIDERTGEMLTIKTPCIALTGVDCKAIYSTGRLFCPRAITAYWRENWLARAPTDSTASTNS